MGGVTSVGCSSDPAVTRFGPARRNKLIIHYCTAGKGYFNGAPVGRGEGFVIRPGDPEEYHPDADDPWTFLWLVIDTPDPESMLTLYREDPNTHVFPYVFADQIERMEAEIEAHFGAVWLEIDNFRTLIQILRLHEIEMRSLLSPKPSATYAQYAKEYMEHSYFLKITMREIAQKIGVSASYLYRVFVGQYHCSPKEYLTRIRLEQAQMLLANQAVTVTEAGRAVGYENVLEFSKAFKRWTGVSPKAYRGSL